MNRNPHFREIAAAALSRRAALRGIAGMASGALLSGCAVSAVAMRQDAAAYPLGFAEVTPGSDGQHHVSPGYAADVLIRWGDPVLAGAPAFAPEAVRASAQALQFGYNNDYVAFLPLPRQSRGGERGLLTVNHEFTSLPVLSAGRFDRQSAAAVTADMTAADMAAHGMSVVEIERQGGKWRLVAGNAFNRRITARTPMRLSGPAAGHARLATSADPSGRLVLGTISNCGGGKTPWGTVLSGEEHFPLYFTGTSPTGPETASQARYGVGARALYPHWAHHDGRFDLTREPREANRFGWVVEIDPYDSQAMPVKRTALGRLRHEGANCVVNGDGRVVVYMGDDEPGEYIYRFVSAGRFDAGNRRANAGLLDSGTLSVARFDADGSLVWLPLAWGSGALVPDNGFASQADVLIDARRAADLLGATPMDRPEDVEANPATGIVYAMLAGNEARTASGVDPANPRARNIYGHVVALVPPGAPGSEADHAADRFAWRLPLLAGADAVAAARAGRGWLAGPDNVAFDPLGRMYVATDQGPAGKDSGTSDGIWACVTQGRAAYAMRQLFRCPAGAEMCGPEFTPDGSTLFVAVQHPGGAWPDFRPGVPARPAVVAITRTDGGTIGL